MGSSVATIRFVWKQLNQLANRPIHYFQFKLQIGSGLCEM